MSIITLEFCLLICFGAALSSETGLDANQTSNSLNSSVPQNASTSGTNTTSVILLEKPKPGQKPNKGNHMIQATLPFVLKPLGLIECQGASPELAGQFFEHILGSDVNYNQSDYLCGPTCRGKCVPRPQHIGIPPTFYPFGCNCEARGCGLNGPIVAPMGKPEYRMVCKPDPRCACFGIGPGQFTGYSCHWINLLSGLPVTFKEKTPTVPSGPGRPPIKLPPQFVTKFNPIKWCSCCPRTPRIPKEIF